MTYTPSTASEESAIPEGNESSVTPKWWVEQNGKPDGPFTAAFIATLLAQSGLKPTTLVCQVGEQKWQELVHCNTLVRVLESQSPGCVPPSLPASQGMAKQAGTFVRRFMNPELPWFANWICVYCVVIVPILELVVFLMTIGGINSSADLKPDSPLVGYAVTYDVISFVVGASLAVTLVFGGLLLSKLQKKGTSLIKVGITLRLCWGVIGIVVWVLWGALVALGEQAQPASEEVAAGSVILFFLLGLPLFLLAIACVVFEVVALVWLFRNDDRLPLAQPSTLG